MTDTQKESFCPKCEQMFCEGYMGEGVCVADMHFTEDATANGDAAAEYLRVWYELHRETWWERNRFSKNKRLLNAGTADEFMLGLIQEVERIHNEENRQLQTKTFDELNPNQQESEAMAHQSEDDPIDLQNTEFDALRMLIARWQVLERTAVVDDSYPEYRHNYESALKAFLVACKNNRRI